MKRELSNGPAGTFFQIVNIGDVIGLKRFMSHLCERTSWLAVVAP